MSRATEIPSSAPSFDVCPSKVVHGMPRPSGFQIASKDNLQTKSSVFGVILFSKTSSATELTLNLGGSLEMGNSSIDKGL
uniref:Uncharacterized protein n=1 Tax=Setaria italica TaxID=4555 RepID=K3Y0I3_SETIT